MRLSLFGEPDYSFSKMFPKKWFIPILICFILILYFLGAFNFAISNLQRMFEPIQAFFYQSSSKTKQTVDFWKKDKNKLWQENLELQEKIRKLQVSNLGFEHLKQENQELRRMLDLQEKANYDLIPAEIISRNQNEFSKLVIISKGAADGVKLGAAVVQNEGVLAGKVIQTFSYQSQVMLLIDQNSKLAAKLAGSSMSQGLITGQGEWGIILDFIPSHLEIIPEMMVVTSGLEAGIPSNLLIGNVLELSESKDMLFNKAVISPAADFDNLGVVGVVISN